LPFVTPSALGAVTTKPQCIVSLSPTATDTLFAIGAGHQVQAVDEDSDYPAAAKTLSKKRKINALSPSLEGIIGLCKVTASHPSTKPDLVVLSYNPDGFEQKLTAAGVKYVELDAPSSLSGALKEITELGKLSGHGSAATSLAASIKSSIKRDVASVPAHSKKISVYYELSASPYYSLTSSTFVGSLLKSLGLVNIADPDATSQDAGYPELDPEYIVSANPTIIFTAGDASAASVAKRTGWDKIAAVKDHNVVELNADVASQWGPRLVTLVNDLTAEVKHVLTEK